jgi:hypothetical protein
MSKRDGPETTDETFLKTAVALIIFNRPETTARVFREIRKARPSLLLVVGDGPRPDRTDDKEQCTLARAIVDQIDWDCEVRTNYSDVNLGCRDRVSSGLDWIFSEVEEAVILEDDCLPHPTFFQFCEEMLEKFRHDERIGHIGGANLQFGRKRGSCSYYFSRYSNIWGWASWRRAWINYDVDMDLWPEVRDGQWLNDLFGRTDVANYWRFIFDRVYRGEIDTWDYQRLFQCLIHGRLTVLPNVNLISNIGFNMNPTHTTGKSRLSNMKTEPMIFPLVHPPFIIRDASADRYTEARHYSMKYARLKGAVNWCASRLKKG